MDIKDIDFKGKRALIRVDFNVPLNDRLEVTDSSRIEAAKATVEHVLEKGGSVVLMSHLGRPKGKKMPKLSIEHIAQEVSSILKKEVSFIDDCIGKEVQKETSKIKPGEIILLENLRYYNEETEGNEKFAKELAKNGDVYINDAFGTAHRAHASTAIIAKFFEEKAFGMLMQSEIDNLEKVVKNPEKPVTAIIGGAKVSSKLGIIENLIGKVDYIIVGGGMAFTFLKAIGGKIGDSLVEKDLMHIAKKILKRSREKGTNILLPHDVIVADSFNNEAKTKVVEARKIDKGWMGLDIGPATVEKYNKCIVNSKTILWNGPMGVFEMENFASGTVAVAKSLAEITKKGSYSLVGGGDSVAAIKKFKLQDQVSYVSTGGGAMLEYLEGKALPGIQAIH